CDVLQRRAARVENEDFLVARARGLETRDDLAEPGVHVGAGQASVRNRMMQVADGTALLREIGYHLAACEEQRIDLLLVLVVRAYRGDERSRADHLACDEVAPRSSARDDDVARGDSGRQIGHSRSGKPGLRSEQSCV